ncbi:MAG: pseudouridine synthase [Verrucomicrobiota bacterium]
MFEDDALLVVNKPAGLNTHAPSPYASEGIYDWLRHREPRWASLAIIHRLDKETSGVLVFTKTPEANRSLTRQFTDRAVRKKYLLLVDRPVAKRAFTVQSHLVRLGERSISRPGSSGQFAETAFRVVENRGATRTILAAEPRTGRTHQIRVHAAEEGLPILGDTLYGGEAWARLCLHAAEVTLAHPETGREMTFAAPAEFDQDIHIALREALWSDRLTNCYRLHHGASDGNPGWYADRVGSYLLSSSNEDEWPAGRARAQLERWMRHFQLVGVYHKRLRREPGQTVASAASPRHILGPTIRDGPQVVENGLRYQLSFQEGYSIGLFLDQRENRRRLLTRHVAAGFPLVAEPGSAAPEVLNTFAYTCAFSVSAAAAGCRTTSLDLSRRYLDWGRRNFACNGLAADAHEFVYGDALDWMHRFGRKGRRFQVVILDPPTFSRSKEGGAFRVEKDYPHLASLAVSLLADGGVLFASTNAATVPTEWFVTMLKEVISSARRQLLAQHYAPQPPDFPMSRQEPSYLKTVWLRVA